MTDSFGIVVNVLTSDQQNWFMRYKPKELNSPTEAFITYISPVHYNAIRYDSFCRLKGTGPGCQVRRAMPAGIAASCLFMSFSSAQLPCC